MILLPPHNKKYISFLTYIKYNITLLRVWEVYETKEVTKSLKKLPPSIQRKYKAWVEVVRTGGSSNLKNYPGFRDEKLKGDLRECRSSRLNVQYRVIYSEKTKVKEIIVFKVTPHEYKK